MRKTGLFFVMMLCIGAFSCEEEKESMEGTWELTWQAREGHLKGEIEFFSNKAVIRAFGEAGSPLLNSYSELHYTWTMTSDHLILVPEGNAVVLRYRILNRSGSRLDMQYLDDILVSAERR